MTPGRVPLADWAAIYRGHPVALDERCYAGIARGAEAVTRIVARGEPVYGINTGFGKLASVRIEAADLARLQRNIVLSHCAGVGEIMPAPVTRLMLALKSILSAADATPTLIFDEIDSGISGRSGQVVGEKLWNLTANHQVICVTHLPQIAAFGDAHFNVTKEIHGDRTMTLVRPLEYEQRTIEIGQMLGGALTDTSRRNAEELLQRAEETKQEARQQHLASSTAGNLW